MVDDKLRGEPKHRIHVDTRFKINSAKKEFILEVESPEEKKRWIDALRSNIYYANPAKREGGVCYDVLVLCCMPFNITPPPPTIIFRLASCIAANILSGR